MPEPKRRHGCLTAYLIFMTIIFTLGAASYFFAGRSVARGNPEIPLYLQPVFGITCLAMAVCFIALWKWKKWGFWAFVVIGILEGIVNTYLTRSVFTFLQVPIAILIMYGVLHIGKDRKGWSQLE